MKKLYILTLFCFFAAVPTASAAGLSKPANNLGLVGYWSFNEGTSTKATDFSGNGNIGTFNGSTLPAWVNGKIGKALNFNGSTSYVQASDSTSLQIVGALTISAWVKVTTTPVDGNNAGIVAKYRNQTGNTNQRGYELYFNKGSRKIGLGVTADGAIAATVVESNTVLTIGQWYYVVGVYVPSVSLTVYINGVQDNVNTTSIPASIFNTPAPLWVGTQFDITNSNLYFNGLIDEARIYNRALTATEVQALYNSGGVKVGSSAALGQGSLANGLVAQWSFDGADMTDKVYDRTGGNNGYFVGSATSSAKVAGKVGQALQFDGSTNYVDVGTGSSISLTGPMTVSAWIKTSTLTFNDLRDIISSASTPTSANYQLELNRTAGKVSVIWGNNLILTGNTALTANTWTHVVMVRSGSTGNWTATLYMNGASDGSTNTAVDPSAGSSAQTIVGRFAQNAGRYFSGSMDDVRIYNRALTAAEVKQLSQLGAAKQQASGATLQQGTGLAAGMVGYWSFNGADFTDKVYDRSGNSNNGYVFNSATSTNKIAGKQGQALHLDGADDQIKVDDSATLDPGTSDFAISAWVKSSNMESGDAIVLKTNGGGASASYGFHYGTFGTRQPTMHLSSGAAFTQIQSASSLTLGQWNHVVITVDRDDMSNTKVYINGVVTTTNVTNPTSNTGSISNSVPLSIGAESDGGFLWEGDIDEVRYYMRTLSAEEIKQLYLMGR